MPAGLEKQGCLEGRLAGTAPVGMGGWHLGRSGALEGVVPWGSSAKARAASSLRGQGSSTFTTAWWEGHH